MATLEKIRSKGVLLLVIIGLALLAFIVGDFLNNSSSFFHQAKENIAKINGKAIKIQDYQAAIEQLTNVYKIEYNIPSVDENTNMQIRQSVWENLLRENLVSSEAEKVGLAVGKNELKDLTIGNNPHQLVQGRRIFADPQTGRFDKNRLISFLSQLEKEPTDPQAREQYTTAKSYWMYFENLIKTSKLEEKYQILLSKALNANSIEAKLAFESKKATVDVNYVAKTYASVPDNKVSVSEKEIADKYEKIKERYKQKEETRDVKFVSFPLNPSPVDFSKAQTWINKIKPEFASTKNIESFVSSNNSKPYKNIALSAKEIDPDLKGFAFSGKKDEVFGPTLFGDTYKMARIVENGISSPDSLNLRHIVVATKDKVKTKALADSILAALNSGADFAALAHKYSQMQETAQRGGEIGWIKTSTLTPEIDKACESHPFKSYFIYKDTTDNNGQAVQIMQVTDKTANISKVKLAVINAEVTPSQETYSKIYNQAKQFAGTSRTIAQFDKNAKKSGYVVQPIPDLDENTPTLGMVKNSRQVVKWAFENEQGTVSDVYDCEKQFVVASVTNINPKGYKSLKKVSPEIKTMIINDKKADLIIADLKTKNTTDLNTLATQIASKVDSANQINFESMAFGKAGFEPEVITDAAFGTPNKVSAPIKGKQGVYVIKVTKQTINPAPFNAKNEKSAINMRYMYSVYGAVEALKDKADIEDNRSKFY
jgi:peptidyl-prolyl cis-trans isomerase D